MRHYLCCAALVATTLGVTPASAATYEVTCREVPAHPTVYRLDTARNIATTTFLTGEFDLRIEGNVVSFYQASEDGAALNEWTFDLSTGAKFHRWRGYIGPENAEAIKGFAHDTPADRSANASLVAKYFDGMREPPTDGRDTCAIKKVA